MNDVIQNMKDRRSVREYEDRRIPRDILEQIVEAGYFSPNAGNRQYLRMVVCENREINQRLGRLRQLVTQKFWYPKEGDKFEFSDEELDQADVRNSFYDAPCVVYLFSRREFEFAEADAYIMSNNLCLAARSFDVGSCVISVVTDYFLVDSAKRLLKEWRIFSHAILGYPKGGFPEAKPHDIYASPVYC